MKIKSPWGTIARIDRESGPRYRLRGQIEGVQRQIGMYATLDEALAMAEEMRAELAGRPGGLTVGGWVESWIDARERAGRHRDVKGTRRILEAHVLGSELDWILLRRLEPRHIHGWLRRMSGEKAKRGRRIGEPVSEGTLRNRLRALSVALSDAHQAGEMPMNPAIGVRVPKVAQEGEPWTFLTLEEIEAIETSKTLPRKQRVAYTVAIYTGLRAGELWGLRVEDVRLGKEPELNVRRSYKGPTKSGRARRVPLLPPAAKALEEWLHRDGVARLSGPVFFVGDDLPPKNRRGEIRHGLGDEHVHGYDAGWADRWRAHLGIREEVRFHDLRHTCASHLVMGSWGRPWRLEEVQLVLGHASRATTERYAHLAPESISGAARQARDVWAPKKR